MPRLRLRERAASSDRALDVALRLVLCTSLGTALCAAGGLATNAWVVAPEAASVTSGRTWPLAAAEAEGAGIAHAGLAATSLRRLPGSLASTATSPGTIAATACAAGLAIVFVQGRRPLGKPRIGQVAASSDAAAAAVAPPKASKVRIEAFDSVRFFLIAYIVCGHFISFASPTAFAFRAMTQINVVVGAFFVISGYVAAYTTTNLAERAPDPRLLTTPKPLWILQRVFGYFPLHLLVLALFSPVFLYPDVLFSGWPTALWHAFLSVTMTVAWFPMHAEIWNAPTWFLSALTFATILLPFCLPVLAKQNKKELRRTFAFLMLAGLLPKLGYCYDHNAWGLLEGTMSAASMPNVAVWNVQRFNPFFALIEVLLGAAACRLVMLDGAEGEKEAPKVNVLSTFFPIVGMIGIIYARATGALALSDLLTRSLLFIPTFLRFLMSVHRASVKEKVVDPIVKLLGSRPLVALGGISFPIFVVHGPVGQIFFKKIIAAKLFGAPLHKLFGPKAFYLYLATVLGAAWLLQKTFLSSKGVKERSGEAVKALASVL